jgi:hypothetical protein
LIVNQRNYLAEVGLATILARERAMMSAAKVSKELRQFFGKKLSKLQIIWMV